MLLLPPLATGAVPAAADSEPVRRGTAISLAKQRREAMAFEWFEARTHDRSLSHGDRRELKELLNDVHIQIGGLAPVTDGQLETSITAGRTRWKDAHTATVQKEFNAQETSKGEWQYRIGFVTDKLTKLYKDAGVPLEMVHLPPILEPGSLTTDGQSGSPLYRLPPATLTLYSCVDPLLCYGPNGNASQLFTWRGCTSFAQQLT